MNTNNMARTCVNFQYLYFYTKGNRIIFKWTSWPVNESEINAK